MAGTQHPQRDAATEPGHRPVGVRGGRGSLLPSPDHDDDVLVFDDIDVLLDIIDDFLHDERQHDVDDYTAHWHPVPQP